MKTVGVEQATLDRCIEEARHGRVIITRNGEPVALLVGIEGMDEEQLGLSGSPEFWKLIGERRRQKTLTREELEERLGADS